MSTRMVARIAAAALMVGVGTPGSAVPLFANITVTADDASGRSMDADMNVSPTEHLSFSAGAGHSEGSDATANARGTALHGGAAWHGERAGVSLDYDHFDDQSNYLLGTAALAVWLAAGDFRVALLGRHRDTSIEYTLELPRRTLRREIGYAALGAGLQLSYTHGDFSAYVTALDYDYDDDFERFLELQDSPLLERRPRVAALVGSFITQAQGAIDNQAALGAEFAFGRHSIALDLSHVHDAILDASSNSASLSYRRVQSAHVDWSLALGMIDSARYGSIGFVSATLGLTN